MVLSERIHRTLLFFLSILLIFILIFILTVPLTTSAQEDEDGEGDPRDDGMSTIGYVALGGLAISLLLGTGSFFLILWDTAHKTMSTRNWMIGLVSMIVGVYLIPGLLVAFLLPGWTTVLYIIVWPVGWCVYFLLYDKYRKRSVPKIEAIPEVYKVRTEKLWKTVAVFGILIFGFLMASLAIFSIIQGGGNGEGLGEIISVSIVSLITGAALFSKWLTPGELMIDRNMVRMKVGKSFHQMPWDRITGLRLYKKVLGHKFLGEALNERVVHAVKISDPTDKITVTSEDIGEIEFKRMLFVLMYYRALTGSKACFTFRDKLSKGWYDKLLPQLKRQLPKNYLKEAKKSIPGREPATGKSPWQRNVAASAGSGNAEEVESEFVASDDMYGYGNPSTTDTSGGLPSFDDFRRNAGTSPSDTTLIRKPLDINSSENVCPSCGEEIYGDGEYCTFCQLRTYVEP